MSTIVVVIAAVVVSFVAGYIAGALDMSRVAIQTIKTAHWSRKETP